jgi:hypothetical protein
MTGDEGKQGAHPEETSGGRVREEGALRAQLEAADEGSKESGQRR